MMHEVSDAKIIGAVLLFVEEHGYSLVFRRIAVGLSNRATIVFERLRERKHFGFRIPQGIQAERRNRVEKHIDGSKQLSF